MNDTFRDHAQKAAAAFAAQLTKDLDENCDCGKDHLLFPTNWAMVVQLDDPHAADTPIIMSVVDKPNEPVTALGLLQAGAVGIANQIDPSGIGYSYNDEETD